MGWLLLGAPPASVARSVSPLPRPNPRLDARTVRYRNLAVQQFSDLRAHGTLVTRSEAGSLMTVTFSLLSKMDEGGHDRRVLTWVSSGGPFERGGFVSLEGRNEARLWTYHPTARRARRSPVSNLDGTYLESEFRYEDVIRPRAESVADEAVAVIGEEKTRGRLYWIISVAPAWRGPRRSCSIRQVLWIQSDTFVERRIDRYDCHGALKTTMTARRWSQPGAGGRWFALERHIKNVRTGVSSQIVFEHVDARHHIPVSVFAPHHLSDAGW